MRMHQTLIFGQDVAKSKDASGADPGFFVGGGALVSCSTSTPINRIPVVLENRRSSQGGGGRSAHPLHPPPRSAPVSGYVAPVRQV